ncbi:hypothetical protein [Colwellia sp. D2M02]|uniref:COG4648 family protein n=1 Tax=Colwellia sp. D2M02 TaxID=2841562 RepID=UPI00339D85C7
MTKILVALSFTLIILYPVAVYTGLQYLENRTLAFALIGLFLVRLVLSKRIKQSIPWMNHIFIAVIAVLALTAIFDISIGVLLYPLVINLSMLAIFAYSLLKKPSIIETLARLQEPNLPTSAIPYTENVTRVWCVFFIINGTISLYTALFTSIETWTLYNGLIAYLLMGTLMTVEWLVRQRVKAKHSHD